MTQRASIRVVAWSSMLLLAGCGEAARNGTDDPSAPGNVLRLDTAGAALVEKRVAEIVVDVGRGSERPEFLFHRIRAGILTDDGFWIANGGSDEVRFYAPDGSFEFALGGPGQGPGEFASLRGILLLEPGTLLAFDASGRATVFGPDRQVLRTFAVPWFEDGLRATEYLRLGAAEFAVLVKSPRDPRQHLGETRRDFVELIVADDSGQGYRRTGLRFADRWWTFSRATGTVVAATPPDGPSALLASYGSGLATSTSERAELRVWSAEALTSAASVATDVEPGRDETDSDAPRVIDQVVGTDDGGLWVGLHPASDGADRTWMWINSDAEVAARLELPGNLWLLDVRGDGFLARATDSQGNESVQVLAVR